MLTRFRWVSLQLEYLCTLRSSTWIERRLGKLPKELIKLYEDIYSVRVSSYEEEERNIAERVFRWLLCSQRAFSVDEFITIVGASGNERTDLSKEALLDLCFNFVVLDKDLNIFRFAHLSVREYLEAKGCYETAMSHAMAAEWCLYQLTSNFKMEYDTFVPFEYAYWYWPLHLSKSGDRRRKEKLGMLFQEFVKPRSPAFRRYSHMIKTLLGRKKVVADGYMKRRIGSMISSPPDPVFAACAWGFCEIVEARPDVQPKSFSLLNSQLHTPLIVSCEFGQYEMASLLLDRGFGLEAKGFDGATALAGAVMYGHDDVVQLLLERGANIQEAETPQLCTAAFKGYENIVKLLINHSADVNAQGSKSEAALQIAALKGHVPIVRLLLEAGANTGPTTSRVDTAEEIANLRREGLQDSYSAALDTAIERCDEEMVQLLLDYGAVVTVVDLHGWTPYLLAWANGYDNICSLLSEISPSTAPRKNPYGKKPSQWIKAIESGQVTIHDDGLTVTTGLSPRI